MKIFAERVKELRLAKGLPYATLAKQLDTSGLTICRWESQQHDANGYSVVKIAKYFNVTTDYLLGLED